MQEPKYMAQGDWVTYDTKELGRVRTFRAPSKEMASYLAHKLTTFDQLLAALEDARSWIDELSGLVQSGLFDAAEDWVGANAVSVDTSITEFIKKVKGE